MFTFRLRLRRLIFCLNLSWQLVSRLGAKRRIHSFQKFPYLIFHGMQLKVIIMYRESLKSFCDLFDMCLDVEKLH